MIPWSLLVSLPKKILSARIEVPATEPPTCGRTFVTSLRGVLLPDFGDDDLELLGVRVVLGAVLGTAVERELMDGCWAPVFF